MSNTAIKPGILYIYLGGTETIAVKGEAISVERLHGTGHLSRGPRGYVDRCVFPGLPNLTREPLKRKVIRILERDIGSDAVAASLKCVEQQVAYLLRLPDELKPKIIAYEAAASITENLLVESFIAVNDDFEDELFFNLSESLGYPVFKQVAYDSEYIPEFLRMPMVGAGESLGADEESGSVSAPAPDNRGCVEQLSYWDAPRLRERCLFGRDHGGERLSWDILDIQDGRTLLLSDRIVDVFPYADNDDEECARDESSLSEYVAAELIYDLFSSAERAYIEGAPRILSARELERGYPRDEDRIAYPTVGALSKGLKVDTHGAAAYWTSTPGYGAGRIEFVRPDGDIDARGWAQDDEAGLGVRLAITLRIDVRAYSRNGSSCVLPE